MPKITLREVTEEDLINNLDIIRNEKLPKLHRERLNKQLEGKSVYFIAFEDKKPVGHIYVNHQGDYQYPLLEDLFVKKTERKRGIAKEILRQVELYAEKQGYEKLGINSEVGENWVQQFYENIGFAITSGPHTQSWTEKDTGKIIVMNIYHLHKKLK